MASHPKGKECPISNRSLIDNVSPIGNGSQIGNRPHIDNASLISLSFLSVPLNPIPSFSPSDAFPSLILSFSPSQFVPICPSSQSLIPFLMSHSLLILSFSQSLLNLSISLIPFSISQCLNLPHTRKFGNDWNFQIWYLNLSTMSNDVSDENAIHGDVNREEILGQFVRNDLWGIILGNDFGEWFVGNDLWGMMSLWLLYW